MIGAEDGGVDVGEFLGGDGGVFGVVDRVAGGDEDLGVVFIEPLLVVVGGTTADEEDFGTGFPFERCGFLFRGWSRGGFGWFVGEFRGDGDDGWGGGEADRFERDAFDVLGGAEGLGEPADLMVPDKTGCEFGARNVDAADVVGEFDAVFADEGFALALGGVDRDFEDR